MAHSRYSGNPSHFSFSLKIHSCVFILLFLSFVKYASCFNSCHPLSFPITSSWGIPLSRELCSLLRGPSCPAYSRCAFAHSYIRVCLSLCSQMGRSKCPKQQSQPSYSCHMQWCLFLLLVNTIFFKNFF